MNALQGEMRDRPILVIEDTDGDFEILQSSLRAAQSGQELQRLRSSVEITEYIDAVGSGSGSRPPLMVLLDLHLPGTDGREVLQKFRSHRLLQTIPIIILTSSSQRRDIEDCYRLGASGYMIKPHELDRFDAMVRQMSEYWLHCVELPPSSTVDHPV